MLSDLAVLGLRPSLPLERVQLKSVGRPLRIPVLVLGFALEVLADYRLLASEGFQMIGLRWEPCMSQTLGLYSLCTHSFNIIGGQSP